MTANVHELLILGPEFYFGHEGEENGQGDQTSNSGDDPDKQGEDSQDNSNGSTTDADDDDDKDKDKDPAGLKSALAAERRRAKAAERELNRLKKAEEDKKSADEDAVAHAQKKEQEAQDRINKLSAGFLQRELDSALREAATKAGFIDPADAIDGVDRNSLTYEQDDENPADIDIDEKSVEKAVKALAAKKPHFIKTGTDDGDKTGGGFGGGNSGDRKDKDAALKAKYSALN